MNSFYLFISFLILQRLTELFIAKRNEKWLIQNGAIEYGKGHYIYIVILHVLFILSMIIEYRLRAKTPVNYLFLILFLLLTAGRFWTIASLGKYWNTKIFRIPGSTAIKKGPYRFVSHPNYIIVLIEIAITPLIFHLYFTSVIFSILNAIVLNIRIKEENKAWN